MSEDWEAITLARYNPFLDGRPGNPAQPTQRGPVGSIPARYKCL
eukprot:CAMPEP_0116836628 /NCGR_PEP_ID=MMETSP0418-20121206/8205_1 /TAXON_ID=1158023 /ORGANISM="Astrosyne radiata, Strain 13vi08-1A" /LENGTH=43 /DNA_ID= /DNA_START= /DNA_END= /DNA_ORIENTATION=